MNISHEDALATFAYNPETGKLTRRFKGGHSRIIGVKARPGSYVRVGWQGRDILAHRLIWLIVHGRFPDGLIDHVNGDPSDNRLENLRIATDAENKRNVGIRSHNTSGIKGVSWDKENRRWLAHATHNGRGFHLGRHLTKEAAAEAYRNFARTHHGEFYREQKS